MIPLRLVWSHCPDGVELVGKDANAKFRPKTERVVPVTYDVTNLEDTIAFRFINAAHDSQSIAAFFGRFGMPSSAKSLSLNDAYDLSANLLGLIVTGTNTTTDLVKHLNMCIEDSGVVLKPSVDMIQSGGVRLSVNPSDLAALMIMEMATAAEVGAEAVVCDHCETPFLVGPLTGRRSHAKYCSDRCRVAAMRARNAQGEDANAR